MGREQKVSLQLVVVERVANKRVNSRVSKVERPLYARLAKLVKKLLY